ncbi:uncharacterized protein Cht6 isoform X2 [Drosophila virilis]|uniref:uncharacterized protein Cht6 isoform X2 n=1 Tax=Drosophila virilis TaxID=7244 RepID=UPI001395D797|nr:mucin-5AC isoform X2 [Drosophila virilis]
MLPFRPGVGWQTLLLLCALAYCIDVASSEGRVVCYYTNWSVYRPGTAKFNPQNINPYLCTHLVYAFGGFTKDNQMKPFDKYQDIEQGGYAKFTGLKTYNKQLKTMIAIGGWNEASSRFSPLVASADRRQQFIKNILKFLRQNHFDGIDLDWEYPAHREGGKSRDRDNYAQFVQELRSEFEREAEKTGRSRLLLTMAVPAGIEYIDKGYDVPKLNKYLDWFNVLTYDFHSSHEPSVNHHAPLYSLEDDSEYNYDAELNIDYSIKYYLKAGADRDKLVLGIPTYGRSYTLINEESTELGAPSEGPGEQGDATREKGYLAYYEICQTLKEDPEWTVVQPNENVMGPYAYRRNQWVGYDDEAIVRKKAEYVVAHGLGGIMFWAIDNDDFRGTCSGKPYPLIEAAKEAMLEAFGLGINEVAKSNGPQKPSRSRSRDNGITSTRNHLTSESEVNARKPSATRRPAHRGTTTTTSTTTIKLTEAKGPSLYIGGRASTTPPPPTTPDPGSDFKCEEEGFFQHPRDCKKYYWCLDSGPSGLGIVAHQFTCPSGLYFNPAADSCDFARNVPCKTQKQTTARPITSTSSTTTTTQRPTSSYNRVTAAPVARPVYPRITSTSSTTTRTTTAASAEDVLEYEEDDDDAQTSSKSTDAEEDPQVIKELIDLIRKVGGVEQLEKHLLRNKDGSITLKENVASGAPTTPSTISKSLYDRVLNRPETLGTFTRQRLNVAKIQSTESVEYSNAAVAGDGSSQTNNSKYSSVLRGNSRQGPQNEGLEKLAEFDGFLKERKPYVTINRNRGTTRDEEEAEVTSRDDDSLSEEEADSKQDPVNTTRRPIGSVTPSYTSLRRSRPTTTSTAPVESVTEPEQPIVIKEQTQTKHYATLSRTRGRSTERPQSTVSEPAIISNTNRYKYLERTQPTKSSGAIDVGADANDHDSDEDEEEYEDEPQQKKVTVPRNQSTTATSNTRKYASIGRRTKTTTITTTTPPETTTITGAETAKASTLNNYNNNNNNNNRSNTVKINNVPATTPASISIQSDITTTTTTIINETTEPVESTSTTNSHTTTTTTPTNTSPTPTPTTTPTPTPPVLSTIQTPTTSIDSLSMADGITDFLESQFTTLPPANEPSDAVHLPALDLNINNLSQVAAPTTTATVTTTESEQAKIRTTGNREQNNIDSDEDDNDNQINNVDNEVTTIKTKYATSHRRINTTNNNSKKNNAAAVNDTSPNFGNSQAFSSSDPTVNIIKSTYSGRRQPQRTQLELNTTELPVSPTNINTLGGISSPRPFGYPRRRTRPTATKPIPTITTNSTVNNYDNDSDNVNNTRHDDVAGIGKTRLSKVDRPKNRYQVSRTRGPTTTTTARPTASTTTAKSTTRRLSFGSRSRVQVTKISNIDDVSTEKTEESEEDDDATETTTVPTTITTATTTTATTSGKPKLKRIRVLKYRRPLQPIDSSNSTASTTNSASSTYTENTNHTITIANNTTNPIKNTPAKKFRKIVRKLRPVETTTESNKLATDEPSSEDQQTVAGETTTTTRKPFLPSHSRFGAAQHVEPGKDADEDSTDSQKQSVQPERRPVDLQRLRNRLKSQQSRGEPTDGVINSRLRGKDDKNIDEENESEGNSTLQQLRDKVKAEQARGSGEQGVINDRLKQLLVERTPLSTTTTPDNDDVELNVSSSTPASSQRPVFRRKLVAKRPYAPSAATTPTKAALVFSSTRPTAKFVRRKNGRYDPFNSNVRNRGEGFVRSDPRGARLPGADRFKQEQKEIDVDGEDADYEQQQEHPQPLINTSPLGSQVAVRRPFIPKNKQPEQDQENAKSEEEYDDDDEDEDEDNEDEDEEEEQPSKQQGQEPVSSQEQQLGDSTSKPQFHTPPAYRPKDNRVPPGNRPNFAPTASGPNANGGNVPFNPRNRQTNFSTVGSSSSAPVNRFGGSNRPRVVNRPPGVATPNLTLRPVANNYERTTPLTPLKPAPFIPSNNRSYERKYTGPSTETPEITSENPLIEDLNIDALNARNKKIFDIHSKKHTTLKPKVAAKTDAELETEVVESEDAYDQLQQRQGYVTTTPTTPTTNPTSTQSTDTTNTETETAQPQIVFHEYANEATNISSPPQDKAQATLSLTTLPPPPATTLLHVFTLVEGENEEEQEPTGRPLGSKTTAVEPKHKLIEINRIVEINSKQTKAAQRKSKANQDFGTLRVESLPHVEQLGEISVVKYVHLVDGSDIQINDGHSTVADYTPTEPSVPKNSAPVRNSLPQTEGDFELDRSGKSLLPEVIREAFETSTISLEGLFDSARKAKQLSIDTNNAVDRNADTTPLMDTDLDTINTTVPPTAASALPATYPISTRSY